MESYLWERERKAELEKEVPDGCYKISDSKSLIAYTGKLGFINYTILMEDQLYKQLNLVIGIDTTLAHIREMLKK